MLMSLRISVGMALSMLIYTALAAGSPAVTTSGSDLLVMIQKSASLSAHGSSEDDPSPENDPSDDSLPDDDLSPQGDPSPEDASLAEDDGDSTENAAENQNEVPQLFPTDMYTVFGSNYSRAKPVVAVGLGYQKCGTTVMSDFLAHHPNVVHSGAKEKHYLAGLAIATTFGHSVEMVSECLSQGPPSNLSQYFEACFNGKVPAKEEATLDITPSYGTIRNVDNLVKSLKSLDDGSVEFRFIAVIREPVARAISAYGMKRKIAQGEYAGLSDSEMDELMLQQLSFRSKGALPRAIIDGEYGDALAKFLESFPKEQLLVVNSEKLSEALTWRRIFQHLGLWVPEKSMIQEWLLEANEKYQMIQKKKYSEANVEYYNASQDVRSELTRHYEQHNERLWEVLDSPKWW